MQLQLFAAARLRQDSQKTGEDFRRRNEKQRYRATATATKLDLQLKSYSKSSLNSN